LLDRRGSLAEQVTDVAHAGGELLRVLFAAPQIASTRLDHAAALIVSPPPDASSAGVAVSVAAAVASFSVESPPLPPQPASRAKATNAALIFMVGLLRGTWLLGAAEGAILGSVPFWLAVEL
jgi:hypothetical protein